MSARIKSVFVVGDLTIDMNGIAEQTDEFRSDKKFDFKPSIGGTGLLATLISEIGKAINNGHDIIAPKIINSNNRISNQRFIPKIHNLWTQFPPENNKEGTWRIERFLGSSGILKKVPNSLKKYLQIDHTMVHKYLHLLILDDKQLGFSDLRELWPKSFEKPTAANRPIVLLRINKPEKTNNLLCHLITHHKERSIILMTANDIRKMGVRVSKGLSWEQTAEDLCSEFNHNPSLAHLRQCSYVVISFNKEGALLLSNKQKTCTLFFNHKGIEDLWQNKAKGRVPGNAFCITAAIAFSLMIAQDSTNLTKPLHNGILLGLDTLKKLLDTGYLLDERKGTFNFPTKKIVDHLIKNEISDSYVKVDVPQTNTSWNINKTLALDFKLIFMEIFNKGLEEALKKIPIAQFGALTVADRREIESLRAIEGLIGEYLNRQIGKSEKPIPLSIAVFGPPGSGKSFSVTEVAKKFNKDKFEKLTFNLSQLNDPKELIGAFHQVRDSRLKGKIPLVNWDEFDTKLDGEELGWLRYFLSPMQDGTFLEGQVTHPIGKCIFIFSGGTADSMIQFKKHRGRTKEDFKKLKGPDFISRLKGCLDILGVNKYSATDKDEHYLLRRAILLHAIIKKHAEHLCGVEKIDPNVLDAFLNADEYLHSARSLEAIISMSYLAEKSRFDPSSLPSLAQLRMHVNNADEFMNRARGSL